MWGSVSMEMIPRKRWCEFRSLKEAHLQMPRNPDARRLIALISLVALEIFKLFEFTLIFSLFVFFPRVENNSRRIQGKREYNVPLICKLCANR